MRKRYRAPTHIPAAAAAAKATGIISRVDDGGRKGDSEVVDARKVRADVKRVAQVLRRCRAQADAVERDVGSKFDAVEYEPDGATGEPALGRIQVDIILPRIEVPSTSLVTPGEVEPRSANDTSIREVCDEISGDARSYCLRWRGRWRRCPRLAI